MAEDFTRAWRDHRVNAGTRLTVRLDRTGGLIDSPAQDQVRSQLGADRRVSAGIGTCSGGIFGAGCPTYDVPVTVNETAVLRDVLPETVVVSSGGLFGVPVATDAQTWEVVGVRFEGVAGEAHREQAEGRQEEDPTAGRLARDLPWALVVPAVLIAFAFTGAGQGIIQRIIEEVGG